MLEISISDSDEEEGDGEKKGNKESNLIRS